MRPAVGKQTKPRGHRVAEGTAVESQVLGKFTIFMLACDPQPAT